MRAPLATGETGLMGVTVVVKEMGACTRAALSAVGERDRQWY